MAVAPLVGDPRFFRRSGAHTLAEVAAVAGGETAIRDLLLTGIAPLQAATAEQVSFLDNRKYKRQLAATRAGAVVVHPDLASVVPEGTAAIVTTQPYVGWAKVAALFCPPPPLRPGVHPRAFVDAEAKVDPSAEIGPLAVVLAGAEIGPRCRIGPNAVVGEGVVLGEDCRIGANASVSHALVGARVYVYPGARIGQEGFGFAITAQGFLTVPQLGRVLIGDDVEIGANTTVDRGSTGDTVIGAGSRLDNLVQIGHNVRLGRCCVIVAQCGISGSTVIEDFVQLGGQVGLTGHITVGRGARIGAQAGVMADVPAGAEMIGSPAQPSREFLRQVAILKRLAKRPASRTSDPASGDLPAAPTTAD